MTIHTDVRVRAVVASILAAGVCVQSYAAEQDTQDSTARGPAALEEVTVTAQRRAQALEDVPISITAISQAQMEALNIRDVMSVQALTPSLTFTSGISYSEMYIRGVGAQRPNPGREPAVATYIDGAYLTRGFGSVFDFLDVESVQVLKGPQGTLWGRNATGGAMVISTNDPTGELEGRVLAEVGNIDHRLAEVVLNVPLGKAWAFRFAGRYSEDGGYVTNLVDGFKFGARENATLRGKVSFQPTDNFGAVFQYQYDDTERTPGPNQGYLPAPLCLFCGASSYALPVTDPYTTVLNTIDSVGGIDETDFYNLKLNWDVGAFSLQSISAWRSTDNFETGDFDFTDLQRFNLVQYSGAETFTEELQASSDFDGMFNFVGGFSYSDDESYYNLGSYVTSNIPTFPLATAFGYNTVNTESVSVYAEGTFKLTEKLSVIAGGRYTDDTRELVNATTGAEIEEKSWDNFTPRIVLSYQVGSFNLYGGYNEGFKAGGFGVPAAVPPAVSVEPEEIESWEVGAKYLSDDHRLRASLSLFTYDYTNLQMSALNQINGGSVLENAASASVNGLEADFEYQISEWWRFSGGVSYLDAHYDDYQNAQVQVPVYGANGNITGLAVGFEDLSGFPMVNAPKWDGFIQATLNFPAFANWNGELTGYFHYIDDFDFAPGAGGPLRGDRQSAYTTAKLSGQVTSEDGRYEVGFYVDNLTDEEYYNFSFTTAPFGAMRYIARPRTYAARIAFNF